MTCHERARPGPDPARDEGVHGSRSIAARGRDQRGRRAELGQTLGHLDLVRLVRARRRRVLVDVALPVAAWPSADELADEIHRVALAVPGVEEVGLEFVVMNEEERLALRRRLRADMLGVADIDETRSRTTTGTATSMGPRSWR